MSRETLQMSFKLSVLTKDEGAYFVSKCPALDVCSQGSSEEEAIENLFEALQLFFETCYEMGTLEQVLKDSGFNSLSPVRDDELETKHRYLEVPFSLTSDINAQLVAG